MGNEVLRYSTYDCGQRCKPEDQERDKVPGAGARARDAVMNSVERRPYCADHETDAFPSNPRLDSIPDTCHGSAVKNRPKSTPNTKARPGNYREGDVICCSDSTSH